MGSHLKNNVIVIAREGTTEAIALHASELGIASPDHHRDRNDVLFLR